MTRGRAFDERDTRESVECTDVSEKNTVTRPNPRKKMFSCALTFLTLSLCDFSQFHLCDITFYKQIIISVAFECVLSDACNYVRTLSDRRGRLKAFLNSPCSMSCFSLIVRDVLEVERSFSMSFCVGCLCEVLRG